MSWSEKISAGDWPATVQSVAGTVVIAVFVVTFLVQAFTIPSESMEQTLLIGDYLLVDKFCYGGNGGWIALSAISQFHRGDVIVFHYPVNPAQDFVKRVVACPETACVSLTNASTLMASRWSGALRAVHHRRCAISIATIFLAPILPTYGVDAKWWKEMPKLVEDHQLIIPEGQLFCDGRQSR